VTLFLHPAFFDGDGSSFLSFIFQYCCRSFLLFLLSLFVERSTDNFPFPLFSFFPPFHIPSTFFDLATSCQHRLLPRPSVKKVPPALLSFSVVNFTITLFLFPNSTTKLIFPRPSPLREVRMRNVPLFPSLRSLSFVPSSYFSPLGRGLPLFFLRMISSKVMIFDRTFPFRRLFDWLIAFPGPFFFLFSSLLFEEVFSHSAVPFFRSSPFFFPREGIVRSFPPPIVSPLN